MATKYYKQKNQEIISKQGKIFFNYRKQLLISLHVIKKVNNLTEK